MTGLGRRDPKMIADLSLYATHSAEPQAEATSWLLAVARYPARLYEPCSHAVQTRLLFDHGWKSASEMEQLCSNCVQVCVGRCY